MRASPPFKPGIAFQGWFTDHRLGLKGLLACACSKQSLVECARRREAWLCDFAVLMFNIIFSHDKFMQSENISKTLMQM